MTIWDRLAHQMFENLFIAETIGFSDMFGHEASYYDIINELYKGALDMLTDSDGYTYEQLRCLQMDSLTALFREGVLSPELAKTDFIQEFKSFADENGWVDDSFLQFIEMHQKVTY